jgi:undecaprenyl-diphosphatase
MVSAAVANALRVLVKGHVRRPRSCECAKSLAFTVEPLAWFAADRFSFPSGHALNSFAIGSVIALSFPLLALPVLAVAASVAASRVVLGLHWLSDVLAGALVGLLIGAGVWLALLR